MKIHQIIASILLMLFVARTGHAQTYYPLPENNAYWTILEPYWNNWDDYLYHVKGDTVLNGKTYKKVYKLNDHPTIYDTIRSLHCFMRQDVSEKKIWFILYFYGETDEKLGYDLSVNIGDTVSLPAFEYPRWGHSGDSLFVLQHVDSVNLSLTLYTNSQGWRKEFRFYNIGKGEFFTYLEGVFTQSDLYPTIPDSTAGHSVCLQVDTLFFSVFEGYCGFTFVGTDEIPIVADFEIFPNPCSHFVNIRLKSSNKAEIRIYDSFGRLCITRNFKPLNETQSIDISGLPSGVYFAQIHRENEIISGKIIVQKNQ
ncbi:MAG: T9SS type A sorting domain-containing protein [Bacteroidales bacterium]|nr:T9SS type A sorting domain-containing protein [Bacteroidales bacterium]